MIDDPPGMRNYWSADYHDTFPDDALDVFVKYGFSKQSPLSQQLLLPWGGAVARVGEDATPMTKRATPWITHPFAVWEDAAADAENIEWAKSFRRDIAHYATGGVYLNFIGDEGEDRVRAAYGEEKYARLAAHQGRVGPHERVPGEPEHQARMSSLGRAASSIGVYRSGRGRARAARALADPTGTNADNTTELAQPCPNDSRNGRHRLGATDKATSETVPLCRRSGYVFRGSDDVFGPAGERLIRCGGRVRFGRRIPTEKRPEPCRPSPHATEGRDPRPSRSTSPNGHGRRDAGGRGSSPVSGSRPL